MSIKIGCQVNCWPVGPDFDEGLVTAIREAGEIGFAGIETNWRMMNTWDGRRAKFAALLSETGISLSALFFGAGSAEATAAQQEVDDAVRCAEFLHHFGAQFLMVGGGKATNDMDEFKAVCRHFSALGERTFGEYGVRPCYHLHHGAIASSVDEIDRMMEMTDERYWFLCPDSGIMAKEGFDLLETVRKYRERIPYVHFKDWTGGDGWAMLGEGVVDHAVVLQELDSWGFDGWVISENESKVNDWSPKRKQAGDREWLRTQGF